MKQKRHIYFRKSLTLKYVCVVCEPVHSVAAVTHICSNTKRFR